MAIAGELFALKLLAKHVGVLPWSNRQVYQSSADCSLSL